MRSLALVLCLSLLGCPGWLPAMAAGASWLGTLLDVARAGADAYLARHPSMEASYRIDASILRARRALAALSQAVAAHDRAQAAASRKEALDAYADVVAALDVLGVSTAAPAVGGVESSAPMPAPVQLPPVEAVAASLEAE